MRADSAVRGWSPVRSDRAPRRGGFVRLLPWIVAFALLAPIVVIAIYRVVPPPLSALMLIRAAQGQDTRQEWVPLSRIAPALGRAVIASEDQKFCRHFGFD